MKNIVLIGMPAVGKSTIGVLLAKTLGFSFIDTDLIIQQDTSRLLQDIIDSDGLDAFCIAEESIPTEELNARLKNIKTRGIAKRPEDTIEDVFKRRMELYNEYADITVDCHGKIAEDTVEEICGYHNLTGK